MKKINIGILGATGIVGQNYIKLLQNHPWFQIIDVAASPKSANKTYKEAVKKKWQMSFSIPYKLQDIIVRDVQDFNSLSSEVDFVFSAISLRTLRSLRETLLCNT